MSIQPADHPLGTPLRAAPSNEPGRAGPAPAPANRSVPRGAPGTPHLGPGGATAQPAPSKQLPRPRVRGSRCSPSFSGVSPPPRLTSPPAGSSATGLLGSSSPPSSLLLLLLLQIAPGRVIQRRMEGGGRDLGGEDGGAKEKKF